MTALPNAAPAANDAARASSLTALFAAGDFVSIGLLYEGIAERVPTGELKLLPAHVRGGPDTRGVTPEKLADVAAPPSDMASAERLCVVASGVPACQPDSTFVLHFAPLRGFGEAPRVIQIEGPERDLRVGREVILRAAGVAIRPEVDLGAPEPANDNVVDVDRSPADTPSAGGTLSELTRPGGFVEELIDWITASAEHPSRELALSAVLPFLGALMGRRFSGYRDCRTNLYSIALAPSGYGKDHARAQLKRLIAAEHLHAFAGPARLMSASALRNALIEKPSMNCMIDEIGGPLKGILDPRANVHQATLKDDLLDYFSSAATYFDGAAYAQARAVQVFNPNLCLYGTSTPDAFWNAVTGLQATDGFLARLLLFDVSGQKPALVKPARGIGDVSRAIRERAKAIALAGRGGNLVSPSLDTGERAVDARPVPLSRQAEERRAAFKAEVEKHLERADERSQSILNRAVEHAVKLALIVAVATDHEAPKVTLANMDWACRLAWLSCCSLVREIRDNVADSQREANFNRIARLISRAGADGITASAIADRTRSIDRRQRDEILADLEITGRAKGVLVSRGGRPGLIWYDVAATAAEGTFT